MADVDPVLPWIKPGWVGAEIGVSRGDSAKALLDHGVRFIYLVDPWKKYPDYREAAESPEGYWEEIYQECHRKVLSCYPSRYGLLRMTSAEAARYVPPQLDFCWLDANHQYEFVRGDLDLYWPKVKPGGVLCGHDFTDNGGTCQVSRAVHDFLGEVRPRGAHLELALPCWVIRKGSG